MKKFLEFVAEDIFNKHGGDMSRVAVVFPNKRASLFLNEYLAKIARRPIWSPSYITISDFFRRHSTLTVGDSIKLICDIHKSFTKCTGVDESLDHFFGWGQLLISDFDDIDKNMADVSKVFSNVKDLHEFDDISYLDEEQKHALKHFFSNFTYDDNSELKKRFLQLWCHLEDIYHDFRQRLYNQGIAYEGMLYRDVAENEAINYFYDTYIFVGFNVVQKVEQQVFTNLKKEGKARFYWDFDKYFMPGRNPKSATNEAGHYISQYLRTFPNELDTTDENIYDNLKHGKDIRYISATTENAQARYVNDWLKENSRYKDGKDTAIVLCDESLLPTVIHNIPENVEKINITTGFPLAQTTISSFVIQLLELRTNGFSPSKGAFKARYVTQILSHPYANYISGKCDDLANMLKTERIYNPTHATLAVDDNTSILFEGPSGDKTLIQWLLKILRLIANECGKKEKDPLAQEALFRMYTLCTRLNDLVESGDLDVDAITLQRLMMQLVNSTSIPFHGEPAEGIQIMGILETRNIDFDHVLILSCNEGNMPKGIGDSSFIPYSIRKAHGLTTIDNKVAIYAYYFYNLIQRASDVTITYNNSTENGHTGEMSRFMLQLMIESDFDIKRISLQTGQQITPLYLDEIPKDKSIMAILNSMDAITPTAINRYMRCQLQFYFNYVAHIKEPEEDDFEEMSNRIFGNVFHTSSELLYNKLMQPDGTVTGESIAYALKHKDFIERIVDCAFSETLFKQKQSNKRIQYNGLQLINREVIIRYIFRLLEIDKRLAPFKIKDIESAVYKTIKIKTGSKERKISVGGRIDRLDQIFDYNTQSQRIRIVDYKTGRPPKKKINNVDDIFKRPIDKEQHPDYFLQTMLYAMAIRQDSKYNDASLPVSPALLFIQNTSGDDYDPIISIGKNKILDIAEYEEEFNGHLTTIISEIFNPQTPFLPTEDKTTCADCTYHSLCGK